MSMDVVTGRRSLGRSYRFLWLASTVSNLGDGVRLTALPLLAASLTRDPTLVAGVTAMSFLPWLLFSLPSGALADRVDRRTAMVAANAFRGLVVGVLGLAAAFDWHGLGLIYVVAFLLGLAETLFDTASQALLPSAVAREDLPRANGRLFAAQEVTNSFVGPPLGGFLFAIAVATPFFLDAATFLIAALLLIPIHSETPPRVDVGGRLRAEIAEGLRWAWRHRLIRGLIGLGSILGLTSAGTNAIIVLFALDILKLDSTGFGVLASAGAVGSVAGSLMAPRVRDRFGLAMPVAASLLLSGVSSFSIGLLSNAVAVGAVFALTTASVMVLNVLVLSLRQSIIPGHLLGRVTSVFRMIVWGSMPIGALLGGLVADRFGLRAPFFVVGVTFAGVSLFAYLLFARSKELIEPVTRLPQPDSE